MIDLRQAELLAELINARIIEYDSPNGLPHVNIDALNKKMVAEKEALALFPMLVAEIRDLRFRADMYDIARETKTIRWTER